MRKQWRNSWKNISTLLYDLRDRNCQKILFVKIFLPALKHVQLCTQFEMAEVFALKLCFLAFCGIVNLYVLGIVER